MCSKGPRVGPNQLKVENGAIVSQTYIGETTIDYRLGGQFRKGKEVSGNHILNDSIEELFNKIEKILQKKSNIADQKYAAKNFYMNVKYHKELGFPTEIWYSDMTVTDAEFWLQVENFAAQ